ncbi:MAG TPA: type II secretion system protein GspM [Methylocystis sp.]|nr:type II secretion system protein GspM [Methylocystis sp.]
MNLSDLRRNPQARSALFFGGNIVALLVVYLLLVAPIRGYLADRTDEISQRQTTLERYEFVSRQEDAVKAFAKQVAESNARGELIGGDSAGIVNANLQARLKALAEEANVTVRSLQMLPPKTLRGATLVGARLDVSAPIDAMQKLARALERETPLLFVTGATMRGQAAFWGLAQVGQQQGEATLEAQIDVYGGSLMKERS